MKCDSFFSICFFLMFACLVHGEIVEKEKAKKESKFESIFDLCSLLKDQPLND